MIDMELDASEVIQNIEKLNLEERVSAALEKACSKLEQKAKEKAPVDTGELRDSITHLVDNQDAYIYSTSAHAPYVHQGTGIYALEGQGRQSPWVYQDSQGEFYTTSGQTPTPFLADAIEESRQDILDSFKDLLGGK